MGKKESNPGPGDVGAIRPPAPRGPGLPISNIEGMDRALRLMVQREIGKRLLGEIKRGGP